MRKVVIIKPNSIEKKKKDAETAPSDNLLHSYDLHLNIRCIHLGDQHRSSRGCKRKFPLVHGLKLWHSLSAFCEVNLQIISTRRHVTTYTQAYRSFDNPTQRGTRRFEDRLYIQENPLGSNGRRPNDKAHAGSSCYLGRYIDRPVDFKRLRL